MKKINNGKLIAVEGISCSGKTTLVKKLEELLDSNKVLFLGGYDVRKHSSEFTKLSNKLSKETPYFDLPLIVELHFLISEILYDIEKIIKPALNQGKTVIYDNYWISIYIIESSISIMKYNKNESKKYSKYIEKTFRNVEKIVDIIEPDLTIFVDSTIESTINRMKNRNNSDFDEVYIHKLQNHIHNFYNKYLNKKNTYIIKNYFDEKKYDENIISVSNFLKEKYINE
jgi:thymidylate kinase